jgi:pantothenate kinase
VGRPDRLVAPALADLVARAASLTLAGHRRILGIAGPPGAGKSTLAEALCAALGSRAALVPMDGLHRSNEELVELGLRDRKGAPETFDGEAFVALLRRLRLGDEVLAPAFDRDLDRVLPDANTVPAVASLVIVEGNYLLLDEPPWAAVRGLLDEAWYLAGDEARVERLIARHVAHGRTPEAAREWVLRSDEANTLLINPSSARADLVIDALPAA